MPNEEQLEALRKTCHELQRLPKDWTFTFHPESKRVIFQKTSGGDRSYAHPTFGELPRPWILCLHKNTKTGVASVLYLNRDTKDTSTHDPRYTQKEIDRQHKVSKASLGMTGRLIKNNRQIDLQTLVRQPIANHSIRDQYQIVHTIDDGGGAIGAMNGGVFVVRMKGIPNRLYVEKRFKKENMELTKKEIKMLHRVKHGSLTFYVGAFIDEKLGDASVYVEFCDRGSLEDLIGKYRATKIRPQPTVPEPFVWHAFGGLVDGLAYLQGGRSFLGHPDAKAIKGWIPILHRDIKPDNVLLRSRTTLGSEKYFYCVLSDFGLACEDHPEGSSNRDWHQQEGSKLGTMVWLAPELLYNPYPRGAHEMRCFPGKMRHSRYTDLWAVGAVIHNLCSPEKQLSHMVANTSGKRNFEQGTESRVKVLTTLKPYTVPLEEAIQVATLWDHKKRPDPITMARKIETLMNKAVGRNQGDSEALPDWATKVHAYQSKAEKLPKH